LALAADACPHAVTLAEAGTPRDRRIFAAGQAAHTYLEALYSGADPNAACAELGATGRVGPDAEPSLPLDAIAEGAELGARWAARNDPPPASAIIEAAISDGVLTTRVDVAWFEADAEGRTILVIRDYKTSWRDDETRVLRTQARVQVLTGLATYPQADAVRTEIANLRIGAVFGTTVWRDDSRLPDWRAYLHAAAERIANGPRVANPGIGCLSCAYVAACEPARATIDAAEDVIGAYCVAKGTADRLEAAAREATADGPIGGVGWYPHETRQAAPDAPAILAEAIGWPEAAPMLERLALGASNIEAAAKTIFAGKAGKADREELVSKCLIPKPGRRWGILKD
jgi:hypothetical protein